MMSLLRRVGLLVLLTAAVAAGFAQTAHAATADGGPAHAAAKRTYVFDAGNQQLVYKPRQWAAGGVGASARMEDVRWLRWGKRSAMAKGTAANNDCDPSCAEGSIIREPGRMRWTRPITCRADDGSRLRYFSRVRYTTKRFKTTFDYADNAKYSCKR